MSIPAAVRGHQVTAPTEQDALDSLGRLLGTPANADVWSAARVAAGHRAGPLSPAAYAAVLDHLKAQGGLTSIVGNSLSVRLRTFLSTQ